HALESCKLATTDIAIQSNIGSPSWAPPGRTRSAPGLKVSNVDPDLLKLYLRKKKRQSARNDLRFVLRNSRDDAIRKSKQAECVVWQMDWAESHMRRCLANLNRLLDHALPIDKESIIHALYKKLRADHVPEQWEQVRFSANSHVCVISLFFWLIKAESCHVS
ncbi:unnamed protein product, partial [Strongylus vulgaris]